RCGYRNIERFGLPYSGNGDCMIDLFDQAWTNTISFVAHHDQSLGTERCFVDILPLEQRAENGNLSLRQNLFDIYIIDLYTRQRAHRGLDDLWVESVHRMMRANNVCDPKPFCRTNDRTQIARILYIIH